MRIARLSEVAATLLGCLGGIAVDRARGIQQPRVRSAAEDLGPTFVKIGQALANRPDLVGSALADELRLLQDAMPPFPTSDARSIIQEDLGAAGEQILSAMPEQPVAAASIGQVYRVELPDGRLVAVKVQRPAVPRQVEQDAELARGAALARRWLRWPPPLPAALQPPLPACAPVQPVRRP